AFEYTEASRARSLLYSMGGSSSPSVAAVQVRMPQGAQLIEYAALDDKLLIFVLSKNNFKVFERQISLDQLTDKVLNFRRLILEKLDSSALARELYDLLIRPSELTFNDGNETCIVPDKILNNLPFGALMSASGRYLIQDAQLTLSPSAAVYLECSNRASTFESERDERLLVVGNPSFDRVAFPSLPPLPAAAQEAERVAGYYNGPVPPAKLIGTGARAEDVKREIKRSKVVHLATHYVVVEESPMKSKLLLAAEPGFGSAGQNSLSPGFLQADEIYKLKPLNARLVVLSACQSGVEHYYNGEGMVGMSRVFVASGVPLVVASFWQVQDEVTRDLMVEFHRIRREDRVRTVEALRQAQLQMLSSRFERYRLPYYWAAFTVIGGHADY
ncbi:MAG TPA: CHAT domain-containing protein, partial [Blastocatellia bacterium]|nr:CHAT domain-containing protein [Blastocatellia bacterium]